MSTNIFYENYCSSKETIKLNVKQKFELNVRNKWVGDDEKDEEGVGVQIGKKVFHHYV